MKKHILVTACMVTACTLLGHAEAWSPVGSKGLAMAGAQVANPEGSQAVNINPAALAKDARFDIALPIAITVGSEGTLIKDVDELYNKYDNGIDTQFEALKTNPTPANIASVSSFFTEDAAVLNKPGQGILANVNGALTARWKRFGMSVGLRAFGGASVVYDGSGFTPNNNSYLADPSLTLGAATTPTGTAGQEAKDIALAATVDSEGASIDKSVSDEHAQDYVTAIKADRSNGDTTSALSSDEKALLTDIARDINKSKHASSNKYSRATDTSSFNNNTGLIVNVLEIKEVGLSYAFTVPTHPKLHIAPTLKIMKGEATTSTILLSDSTSNNVDIGDKLTEDTNTKSSTEFGLDFGALYEYNDKLTLGLMLKDITSPSFETNSGTKIELDMGARIGGAYEFSQKPGWRGLVTADVDLIKSDITALNGGESQFIALGVSQELMGWLSLRGGLNSNLAGESNGVNYSVGLGIQISKLYIDVSGQMSSDEVTIDGDDFPTRGGFGFTLGWNMNF